MIIVPIIVTLLAFYCYNRGKIAWLLICMTFFFTNGYMLIETESFGIKPNDYLLLILVAISINEYFKDNQYFKVKGEICGRTVWLIFVLLLFEAVRTLVFGIEEFGFMVKVLRINSLFLLYFYLRKVSITDLERYVKLNLIFCTFQGVLFYLQVVGISGILIGRIDEAQTSSDMSRYCNYPYFAQYYLIYFLVRSNITLMKRCIGSIFFGGMLIMGMSRGLIMSTALAFALYFFIQRSMKNVVYIAIGYLVYSLAVAPMLAAREKLDSGSSNIIDDIVSVTSAKDLENIEFEGTFAFRIAMLMERWFYIKEDPVDALVGVGIIHEESPHNNFDFSIGTVNPAYWANHCQIESGDITWVPILLRYGLVGAGVYLFLLLAWCYLSYNLLNTNNEFVLTAALLSFSVTVGSLTNMVFDAYHTLFLTIFCIIYIQRYYNLSK